jgi:hypothetical protein
MILIPELLKRKAIFTLDAGRTVIPVEILRHEQAEEMIDKLLRLQFKGSTNEKLHVDTVQKLVATLGPLFVVIANHMSVEQPIGSQAQIKLGRIIDGGLSSVELELEPIDSVITTHRIY